MAPTFQRAAFNFADVGSIVPESIRTHPASTRNPLMKISHSTPDGDAYLNLRKLAKTRQRPTNEMLNLYALEGFLDRLTQSSHVDKFVLKGGVLLAAFDTRRATRDIDLHADSISNDAENVQSVISSIANFPIEDGLIFDTASASSEVNRDEDEYSGVRVTMPCTLATANVSFPVDVNVGDAIWPEPEIVELPRLLGGTIQIRGYSIEMVLAEKIVTAIQRGTANTRWRDCFDIFQLSHGSTISETTLRGAIGTVSEGRAAVVIPLADALIDYAAIAQVRWAAWVRKQGLKERIPIDFGTVLNWIIDFVDPILSSEDQSRLWKAGNSNWEEDHG
jgi:predicted nucleotidyltransferase component of viral defense system